MSWPIDPLVQIDPARGYGASRNEPARNARGWTADVPAQLPNATQELLPLASGGVAIMQADVAHGSMLQLQFLGEPALPLLPAVEVELRQGVDTGAIVWRAYVGGVGVAVPVPAGFILANVVSTRGLPGRIHAQLRWGLPSSIHQCRYARLQVGSNPIAVPLGAQEWEVETGPGVAVTVATGKSTVPVPAASRVAGLLPNDATFSITNAGPGAVDVLVRFAVNC